MIRTPETETPEGDLKRNKWAKVDEYVYENPDKERLGNIAKGLFDLVDRGEYLDLAGADRIKISPKDRKEFRTKDGEVYGFTDGEKIYQDTKGMKPETPLHEYTHLWSAALRRVNPKEWENVKGLLDSVEGLKEEVKKLYPELEGDDLYDEMIATFSGREGTKKLEDVMRRLAEEQGKTAGESVDEKRFVSKVKHALVKFWQGVADMLHIKFTSAEEVADKVLADWAKGFDPRKVGDGVETPSHEEEPHRTEEPAEDKTELNKNAPKGDCFDQKSCDASASVAGAEDTPRRWKWSMTEKIKLTTRIGNQTNCSYLCKIKKERIIMTQSQNLQTGLQTEKPSSQAFPKSMSHEELSALHKRQVELLHQLGYKNTKEAAKAYNVEAATMGQVIFGWAMTGKMPACLKSKNGQSKTVIG